MGYDDLGRLLSANCGSAWGQTFSYDQYGNITKNGSISWACPACYNTNNRYNTTLSSLISYDADGNLLNDTFNQYTWDVYGHPSTIGPPTGTITCGSSGTCLTYDADGHMVEKNVAGVYTEILYSPVGKTAIMNGQTTSSAYFPLPAGATVYETGSTGGNRYFWHKDWEGSVRFASTVSNRGSFFDRAYAPFGETYNNFGSISGVAVSGKTKDTVLGTYDTQNREQNPNQGRWISPDPAGLAAANFTNPQTWNRYAYVTNMPLNTVDPLGLFSIEFAGEWLSDGYLGWGDVTGNSFNYGWDTMPWRWTNTPGTFRANSIFSGQDCLTCFPLGPDPMQILAQVLSGNLAGALQDVGAVPTNGVDCRSGTC